MGAAMTGTGGRRGRMAAVLTRAARVAGLVLLVLAAGFAAEVLALLLLSL